jgi:hypothetical protein
MIYQTKICKMIGPDDPKHLIDYDAILPNIFVGMCLWIDGKMYRIKEIKTLASKGLYRQIIEVE